MGFTIWEAQILICEDEQMFLKSAFALWEKQEITKQEVTVVTLCLAMAGSFCKPSSFLLGLLVCSAAVRVYPCPHMALDGLGAGLSHEVL